MTTSRRMIGNCTVCDLEVVTTALGFAFKHDRGGFYLSGVCTGGGQPVALGTFRSEPKQTPRRAPKVPAKQRGSSGASDALDAVASVIDAIF